MDFSSLGVFAILIFLVIGYVGFKVMAKGIAVAFKMMLVTGIVLFVGMYIVLAILFNLGSK
jgi:hypothetical protein